MLETPVFEVRGHPDVEVVRVLAFDEVHDHELGGALTRLASARFPIRDIFIHIHTAIHTVRHHCRTAPLASSANVGRTYRPHVGQFAWPGANHRSRHRVLPPRLLWMNRIRTVALAP